MYPNSKHVVFIGTAQIYGAISTMLDGIAMHYPIDQEGHPENNPRLLNEAFAAIGNGQSILILDDEYLDVRRSDKDLRAMIDMANEHNTHVILLEGPHDSNKQLIEKMLGREVTSLGFNTTLETIAFAVNERFGGYPNNPEKR